MVFNTEDCYYAVLCEILCKSLWIRASVKCHECKCKMFGLTWKWEKLSFKPSKWKNSKMLDNDKQQLAQVLEAKENGASSSANICFNVCVHKRAHFFFFFMILIISKQHKVTVFERTATDSCSNNLFTYISTYQLINSVFLKRTSI